MYGFWDIRHDGQSFLSLFFSFDPPNNQTNQTFEKMKRIPGDSFILHLSTTNDNHMMYGSWDMEHNRQNFLLFWAIVCAFIPLTTVTIKILKKWKKNLKISPVYTCVPQMIIIWCMVPEKYGWGKHCFSLITYGFCTQQDRYYFEWNLSLVLVIKVFFIEKHVTLFLSLIKKKKELCNINFFCAYPVFHWGDIVEKVLPKVEDSEKR